MATLCTTKQACATLDAGFAAAFGGQPQRYFSAPGRTEIGGNHTDHQHGRVLAAAVNLDARAAVRCNGLDVIRVQSAGYPMCQISLTDLTPRKEEYNTTPALIRGVAAGFRQLGCPVAGFDAYVESTVLPGSGLSSSAAFEVLMGTVINHLFFEEKASQPQVAQIAQYAENVFFGKPCGLMDQMASAVGGLVAIDFADPGAPKVQPMAFDFSAYDHALCIIDSGADHADLTQEYTAITEELKAICACFGKDVLTQIPEEDFMAAIASLRQKCGDRAVLRAMHFYAENRRVTQQVQALCEKNFDRFLQLITQSGESSYMYLQNVIPTGCTRQQAVALTLSLCRSLLKGMGAYRVHGGGFAGTVQAFVPLAVLEDFQRGIEKVLGEGTCHVLAVRQTGGAQLILS